MVIPTDARAMYRYLRARMDMIDGNSRGAREHLEAAGRLDSSSSFLQTRLARARVAVGETEKALEAAEAGVKLDPTDQESRRLLAGLYGAVGMVAQAVREYRKLLELEPDDARNLLYLGVIQLGRGEYREAREYLERYVYRNPESHLGHYYFGRVLAEAGKLSRAEDSYAAALNLNPSAVPPLTELALVRELRGMPSAALETYKKILKVDPRHDWAARRLRAIRSGQQDLSGARAEFDRLGPREVWLGAIRMKAGLIHYELGSLEDAVTEFTLALVERPDDDRSRFFLGLTYRRLRDTEGAVAQFSRNLPGSEYFIDSRIQLASVYEEQGRLSESIIAIRNALEAGDGRRKQLLRFLAEIYRKLRDYPNAIEAMHAVVQLEPQSDRVHFALGALYDESKDKDKTIEYMQKAIELNPHNAAALNYLGYTYADMGVELDRAERLIIRALALAPNDGFYIDSLGWVYYRKGDFQRAVQQLEKAVHLVVDDPVIIEHLGDAYVKDGKTAKGMRSYRDALESANESEQLERIREKIRGLEGI